MSSIHYTLADPFYNRYRQRDFANHDLPQYRAFAACASACDPFKNSPGTYKSCCDQHAANAPKKNPPITPAPGPAPKPSKSSKKSSSSKKDPCAKNCSSFKTSDPNQCKTCCVGNGGDQSTCDTCCGTTSTTDTGTTDTGTTDTGTTDTGTTDTTTTTTDSGPVGGIFERMYQSVCCGGQAAAAYAYPAYTYNVGEQGYLDNWENYDPSDYGDTNYYDYQYPYDDSGSYFAYASKKKSSSSSKKSSGKSSKSSDTSGGTTDSSGGSTDSSGGGSTDTSSAPTTTTSGGGSCSGGIPFMCDDQGKFTMVIVLGLVFLIALSMKR